MKNLKLITIFVLLFTICLMSASANLVLSDVKLGDNGQDRGENTTSSVTVTNNGALAVSDLAVTFPGVSSTYQISGSFSALTIAPNSSVTLTVKGFVPFTLDAVDDEGNKISVPIGSVQVTGKQSDDSAVSATSSVTMEARNKLSFGSESEIKINDETKSLREDKKYSDLKRGDKIYLTIETENTFSTKGNCDDDGTDCEIDLDEGNIQSTDSELDVDEDLDTYTIGSSKSKTQTVSFDIPDDASDGDYVMEMFIVGTDEHNALHGDRWEFRLQVDVPGDELTINSYSLSPEIISCNEKHVSLSVTMKNTGRYDQDQGSIIIDSSKLDIAESVYDINLDEGDYTTKTFELTLPDNLAVGQYFIQIIANVDRADETDRDVARLIVEECKVEQVPPDDNDQPEPPVEDSNTEVKIVEIPPTSGVIYGKDKDTKSDLFGSQGFTLMVAGLFLVALLLMIILIVVILKK